MTHIELMVNDKEGKFQYKINLKTSRVPCVDEFIQFVGAENKQVCSRVVSVFHMATNDSNVDARVFVNLR